MEDDQAYEEDDSTSSAGVCTACGSLVERPITLDTMVADARSMLEGAVPGSRVKVELRVGGVTEARVLMALPGGSVATGDLRVPDVEAALEQLLYEDDEEGEEGQE